MFVWSRNTVRESLHISFFCGRDPFWEVAWWLENTHGGADRSAWVISRSLPSLEREVDLSLCLGDQQISAFSPKLQTLYCLSSPMNMPLRPCIFLFMAGYQNLHTSIFFPVICWSYLQMEISVILSTGNKLHYCHHPLFFSFLWNHFVDVILWPHWICYVHPWHSVTS